LAIGFLKRNAKQGAKARASFNRRHDRVSKVSESNQRQAGQVHLLPVANS
jgi:hypothetical protein